ncbi:glycoside hydrolase family 2 TIM barrel-domain containing protein [Streptomyces sp. NPDC050433]|uniref:glycoside hydrolase family 2 TIM barrel-domain containing protein n=1 Tax=Streptomyces sp. NPDC050433 TaxID=3365615 RepID=UPI00379919E2
MRRTPFNTGWQVREKVNPFDEAAGQGAVYEDVVLPHDALIGRPRNLEGRAANAYFPSVTLQYLKTFTPPAETESQRIQIEFEGVYRDAMVYVNGAFAGQRPSGYAAFTIDLTPFLLPGAQNEILVEARAHEDSRWYTGAGIYRDVWLLQGGVVHVPVHGLGVTTSDVEPGMAVVEVAVALETSSPRLLTAHIDVEVTAPDGGIVATGTVPVTAVPGERAVSRQRLYVSDPILWSAQTPHLYRATARIRLAEGVVDEVSDRFGIRTLQLDPVHGLRVNGETMKLRGTCLHHDNGILGAATFAAAEERRVRRLKEAGFNAIRSAHNPISRAMLDACDRIGMYVMDEAFDMWTSTKSGFDYALAFPEWWRADIQAMVVKDRNHPSVIMYAIGNEIPETGSPAGGVTGRRLAEEIRRLDPTRYITNGVNGMLAVMEDLKRLSAEHGIGGAMEAIGINTMMASSGDYFNMIGSSDLVTEKTAESFGLLDVAGMNYLDSRYERDALLFPNRLIVGTETFPSAIDRNWALVQSLDHVLGDFTWTGWDYLGEVGIGRSVPAEEGKPAPDLAAPYPWIAAWCGDIDLVGHRRPVSYYREIVFGLRAEPYVAVVRPGVDSSGPFTSAWAWSDSVTSWTWPVDEGSELTVEVYSDAPEVELVLNGRSVGRAPTGPEHRFRCAFRVPYEPGELVAIAHRDGAAAERRAVRTAAGPVTVRAVTDRERLSADGSELAFVEIELVDEDGTLFTASDRKVTVDVSGPGTLQALGTANPATIEPYNSTQVTTFDGRALAVVRAAGPGDIRVRVEATGCTPTDLTVSTE